MLVYSPYVEAGATDDVSLAKHFVEALNAKDVDAMMRMTASPFRLRDQKWETAKDGYGFVLGKSADRTVSGTRDRRQLLSEIVAKVHVSKPESGNPLAKSDDAWKHVVKAPPESLAKLHFIVFTRGEADVEHLAIVGIQPRTRKIAFLYVN